jgi:hypothetical protein
MRILPLLAIPLALCASQVQAIGSAFTFQGTLEDNGIAANGIYDLTFQLRTAGGTAQGAPITLEDQNVTRGVFTVQLDFGASEFLGPDRVITLGVRPGASTGAFTTLSPNLPVTTVPYAKFAIEATSAAIADDVIDNAINEVDMGNNAVSNRTIVADAVTSNKIDDGTIVAADIANNTLTLSKFLGASGNYTLSVTLSANDCSDFDVTFGGDVLQGDVPIITIQPGFQLPDSMSITALRVLADNTVEVRICNEADVQQSFSGLGVRLTTLR